MIRLALAILLTSLAPLAHATDRTTHTVLHTVEVRAAAGPPLWKYVRGDRTLWVVGDLGVVRKGTKINETAIRARVVESGAVLGRQGLVVGDNIGIFRTLTLWPAIRKVRFNADGARLADLLPLDVHARWMDAKTRYVGRDDGMERLRPMYAAFELYRAGLETHGLSNDDLAGSIVSDAAKARNVPIVDVRARMPIDDARKAVRTFDVPREQDIACLSDTLSRIDAWLPAAQALADAWAVGDVNAAREVRSKAPVQACWSTLTNAAIARSQGIADLEAHVHDAWREGLRKATAQHAVVFASIPLRDALDGTGLARVLLDEGFHLDTASE
ncbi:TraB/GumN family protein [Lysobacter sp. 2RAF19]